VAPWWAYAVHHWDAYGQVLQESAVVAFGQAEVAHTCRVADGSLVVVAGIDQAAVGLVVVGVAVAGIDRRDRAKAKVDRRRHRAECLLVVVARARRCARARKPGLESSLE
jgi:hypothetical protein